MMGGKLGIVVCCDCCCCVWIVFWLGLCCDFDVDDCCCVWWVEGDIMGVFFVEGGFVCGGVGYGYGDI